MGSKCAQVANAIERDIRNRGLQPGEPYPSARALAEQFNVSPMTADRAMRRLAGTGVLTRRHGAGTFVGDLADLLAPAATGHVEIIIPDSIYNVYRVVVENIAATLHREFPLDRVEQIFVPELKQEAYCRQIIRRWDVGGTPRTVVLVACSPPVQRLFAETAVPVVATGGVAKAHCVLPWIDMDHRAAGRLLGEYARSAGHRRFLVLMNHLWGCGDNDFLDGIDEGLRGGNGRAIEARVRSVELDANAIETVLNQALRRDNPPTGVFCTTRFTAEVAARVARQRNLMRPEDFMVGTVLLRSPPGPPPAYAYTRWAVTRESNDALHQMVRQMNQGQDPDPRRYLIPVELVVPEGISCWA